MKRQTLPPGPPPDTLVLPRRDVRYRDRRSGKSAFYVFIPDDLKQRLDTLRVETGLSMTHLAIRLLEFALAHITVEDETP